MLRGIAGLVLLVASCSASDPGPEPAADGSLDRDGRKGGDDVGKAQDASPSDAGPVEANDAMPVEHLLSVSTTIGGRVELSIDGLVIGLCQAAQSCEFLIPEGSQAYLAAYNETLSFCSWTGDCAGPASLCLLAMDAPKSVGANFQIADQDCF